MRFPNEEKSEVVKKLQKQMSNVEALQTTLERSEKAKEGMLHILTTFELRLTKLEEAIMPIYKETGNLKRRHENIEKTVTMLDRVIGFYHAAEEAEPTINDGPSTDLEKYIECLDKLSDANHFLKVNNCESATTDHVMSLFDSGVSSLAKEFHNLLTAYSKPVSVSLLVAMVVKEEELSSKLKQDTNQAPTIQPYPDKILSSLKKISHWLGVRGMGEDGVDGGRVEFLDTFVNVRCQALVRTLQDIQDNMRSCDSKDSVLSVQSPLNKFKLRSAPKKIAKGKMSTFLKPRESHNNRTAPASSMLDESAEDDSQSLAITIPCLLKLLKAEESLAADIAPEAYRVKVQARLVQCGLQFVLKRTENLSQIVLRAPTKHYSTPILLLLPTLKQLNSHNREYLEVLKNCNTKTIEHFEHVQRMLDEAGCTSLDEYINVIRNDPDRTTSMPKDGTVHELTSNSMFFMEQLLEHSDVVGRMLMSKDTSVSNLSAEDKPRLKLAEFFTKVLSSLGLNLNNKANNLPEHHALKAIFMLNNFNYVLTSLRRSGMMDIIHLWNAEVESFYSSQIVNQKRLYSQSWSKVLHYISDGQQPVSMQPPLDTKLKDKERNLIKERFTGFNKEFEEIQRLQRSFAIPDPDLRQSLINDNKSFILSYYSAFLKRYVNSGFTKNPEKYIKYSEDDVTAAMDAFFEA